MTSRLGSVVRDFRNVERQPLSTVFSPGFVPAKVEPSREAFEPGYRYIFHHKAPSDNVRLATDVLPERLKKAGFHVIDYPRRYTDLTDTFAGGPLFTISFEAAGYKCRLFNAVDPLIARSEELGRDWAPDDYVLAISK